MRRNEICTNIYTVFEIPEGNAWKKLKSLGTMVAQLWPTKEWIELGAIFYRNPAGHHRYSASSSVSRSCLWKDSRASSSTWMELTWGILSWTIWRIRRSLGRKNKYLIIAWFHWLGLVEHTSHSFITEVQQSGTTPACFDQAWAIFICGQYSLFFIWVKRYHPRSHGLQVRKGASEEEDQIQFNPNCFLFRLSKKNLPI